MPTAILGTGTAQEIQLIQLLFFVGFLAPSTMRTLAESTGTITVDATLVFLAPLFGDEFAGSHINLPIV
jgi:hypothetical protein